MCKQVLAVRPLIDIQNKLFRKGYKAGVKESFLTQACLRQAGEAAPFTDGFLTGNLNYYRHWFDGKHERKLFLNLGFYLGCLHGGVLTPRRQLRADLPMLVLFDHLDGERGYKAGRFWFFQVARAEERYMTDQQVVEEICAIVQASSHWNEQEKEPLWNFFLGCVLGKLSGQLFPQTCYDQYWWEKNQHWIARALQPKTPATVPALQKV